MEKIWYREPAVLFSNGNAAKFMPLPGTPLEAQLNAAMRLAIYFTAIVMLLRQNMAAVYVLLFVAGFTYFIHSRVSVDTMDGGESPLSIGEGPSGPCVRTSADNPFMNVLQFQDPKRPAACNVLQCSVKKDIRERFNKNLVRDVDDIFEKKASDRQFYTTPITTVPNDQEGFAKWLYMTPPTRKESIYAPAP